MHILVPVKRVVDANVKVRVKRDGSGVETAGVKLSVNPFDEVALEQAIRLKAQGLASHVTAVTCGPAAAQDVLRTALAMGADDAVLVESAEVDDPGPLAIARWLRAIVAQENATLVLCGKQAIDDDLGATGPMLAALLDWPQAMSVNQLEVRPDNTLAVACDADGGTERLALPLPAVLGVDLRLCEPRHITLPALMRARKAAIRTVPATSLADAGTPPVRPRALLEPPPRPPGVRAENLPALIERLRALLALQAA
ncbi:MULTISPECIES: electron transfer flavoprotein subunit beta/FixA family protein [Cupriavidus]|uniref:Electron transfer flavoprotein subunit beta n=1 Tax=Cupriavidus metallidurans TaxID=119219 RepID=A0A482J369_9BURK|nr:MULTISPECIES: electron transfer flavoprotein subunit beta/FixA family protein [Cupriavidus]MWL91934.1 electron transfer flavoprotein subunit beta/FixA family protein [Cupriavidus sp. SW-Y-13]QBP14556.1 electron transfer flavoprotein subunit beta/FixA family protein [Cupriavidus metallidurans]